MSARKATPPITIDPSPQLTTIIDSVVRIATLDQSDAVKIAALETAADLAEKVKLEVAITDCTFYGADTAIVTK